MSREIIFDFGNDGTVKMEGVGFIGVECDKEMKPFADALGKTVTRTDKKEAQLLDPRRQQQRQKLRQ